MKVSHRSRVFKTRVLCKKNFTYSSVFKPYSDVFKPYSDVLKPYSGVFLQFMQIESLKLDFHINFFLNSLSNRDLKTRFLFRTRVLNTRDASFQYCFEMWQLTKFFNIYCYLEKKFLKIHVSLTNLLSIHNWLQKYLKLRFLLLFGGGRCLTIQNEGAF